MKPTDMPPVLSRLREQGYRVMPLGGASADFALFMLDLSELRLRFSERTPCVWVTSEAASADRDPGEVGDTLRDLARAHGWSHVDCLALIETEAPGHKKALEGVAAPRFIGADKPDLDRLLAAPSITHALLELLVGQVPLSALAPYQIGGPPTRNAFFGRAGEIRRIVRHPLSSFFVTGIRRVGKTWLLGEVRNRLLAEGQITERLPWIDCSTLKTYGELIDKLVPLVNPREFWRMQQGRGGTLDLPAFMARMAALHGGPLTVFLDECDGLLAATRGVSGLPEALRAAATGGHCRFLLAGFQTLVDEITRRESPLYLGFEALRLGPLPKDDTRAMLLEPMAALRVRVADADKSVARLYGDTYGMPRLLQEYCIELVRLVEERGDRLLDLDDVDRAAQSEAIKTLVVNVFRDSAEARDKLAVYALLLRCPEEQDKYTQEDMYHALHRQGCSVSIDDVDRTCDRLVMAGFLARDGRTFAFTLPLLPRLLRTQFNLAFLAKSARHEVFP